MHPSYFLLLNEPDDSPDRDLPLPADVSEWLFHKALWGKLNKSHGTAFEQYEEEVLPSALLPVAIDSIEKLLAELSTAPTDRIEFSYAQDHNNSPLFCTIRQANLKHSLTTLIEFLKKAHARQTDVYCQL